MKRLKQISAVSICLLTSFIGNIQAWNFKTIGVRDGLTDISINHIAKDSEGYVWFATNDGLNRFDGYDVKKYSLKDFGLNFDHFRYVAEDKGGNIWVKSATGRVYYLDRGNDCLTDRFDTVLSSLGIYVPEPVSVFIDKAGNLWVEEDGTMYHYDYSSESLNTYCLPCRCHQAVSDGTNSYLSLEDGRIIQVAPPSGNEFKTILHHAGSAQNIMLDSRGRLWAYGYSRYNNVSHYDILSGEWIPLPDNDVTGKDFIATAIDDNNGHLWFGSTSNGIIVFDHDLTGYQKIEHLSKDELSIPNNHISCLYIDKDNLLWIGTATGAALTSMKSLDIRQIGLSVNESVRTIIEDGNGNLLIGLDGKGLIKYPAEGGEITREEKIPAQNIIGSTLLSDGSIAFASYGGGAFRWDGKEAERMECPDIRFHNETRLCKDIIEDKNGNLWFITFSRGVVCLMPDGKWKHFNMANSELVSNHMTSMTYSPEYDRMFVSNMECIYEISTKTLTLKKISDFQQVTNLYLDKRCILWVGTTDGLYYKDLKHDNGFCHLDMSDGLSHPNVVGIEADNKDDLWVTTNDGFTHIYIIYDPLRNAIGTRCFPYYSEDGIGNGLFNHNAIYCTRDGEIIMGNDGKIIKVRPDITAQMTHSRKLMPTFISVSGKEMKTNEFQQNANTLKIKHNDNLSVKVSSMDYINRNKIKYEYCINGNSDWILMRDNQIFLNRLHSGNHTLSVRAAGSNYPEHTYDLTIIVKPPFYKSTVAMALYALFFILCIIVAVKFQNASKRKIIDQERHEVDEAKLQFFINISHDLRTPLTMIITPLKKLIRDYKGTELEEDLELMNRSATTLMNEVNQLLEFKKLDSEKVAFKPSYGDLARYIDELLTSYNLLFADDSIKLTKDICEEKIMMDFDRDKIMRILHNLMSNAFKFNHPKGYVKVTLQQKGDNAELIVTDSGSGIDDKHKPYIFDRFYQGHSNDAISGNGIGLHIVKEYVELHNGTISVADNYPSGCIFTVSIPMTHAHKAADENENVFPAEEESIESQDSITNDGKAKILIVEDNLPFRKFLKDSLSDKYKVYEAGNGRAALESLEKHSISIIITDVMMPEMDGLELCREVKNDIRYSHIPVILLTAIQNKDIAITGLRDGADEYISKPFDIEVLTLKIDKILKWRQENYEKFSDDEIKVSDLTISRLDEELMKKIMDAIEKNLSDSEYSVEDLSAEVGISRSGLYKKMMFITGKSPIEFIRITKLKKGRKMIDEGETTISQIAWSVGFSPKQFSKYFKDEYGCLPSEYMKYIRQDV